MNEITISYFPFSISVAIFLLFLAYLPALCEKVAEGVFGSKKVLLKNKWVQHLCKPFKFYSEFITGTNNGEEADWYQKLARIILTTLFLVLPIAYDPLAPEAAGDLRWYMMHVTTMALLTLFIIKLITNIKKGEKITLNLKLTPTSWAAFVVVVFGFLTLIWGMSFSSNWWFLKSLVAYSLIFAFAIHLRSNKWYENLLWIIAMGGAFNGLLGMLQYHGINDAMIAQYIPFWDKTNITGFFLQAAPPAGSLSNKNLAASFMVICLPITVYLILTARSKVKLTLASISFTLCATMLLYTRSRGSWVSAIAATVFAIIWLALNKNDRNSLLAKFNIWRSTALLTSMLAIVILGTSTGGSNLPKRVKTPVNEQFNSIKNISAGELETRLVYNINGVDILMENPMGVGLGSFHTIYPKYANSSVKTPRVGYNLGARPRRMHNDMFQAFVELGVLGGLAHLFVFLSPIYMAWRIARSESAPENHKLLSFVLLVSIAGICINSLGDFPLQMPMAPAYLWLSVGMLTGLYVMHIQGAEKGWSIQTSVSKTAVYPILLIITMAATAFIVFDSYKRRESTKYLKNALALSRTGQMNDYALYFTQKAHKIYPYIARLQEIRAVVYTNYTKGQQGASREIDIPVRLAILEKSLSTDPYSQNTLVNLAMTELRYAESLVKNGDMAKGVERVKKSLDYADKAIKVNLYTGNAHTVKGLGLMFINRLDEAQMHFEKALEIDPTFFPARTYLEKIKARKVAVQMPQKK